MTDFLWLIVLGARKGRAGSENGCRILNHLFALYKVLKWPVARSTFILEHLRQMADAGHCCLCFLVLRQEKAVCRKTNGRSCQCEEKYRFIRFVESKVTEQQWWYNTTATYITIKKKSPTCLLLQHMLTVAAFTEFPKSNTVHGKIMLGMSEIIIHHYPFLNSTLFSV